MICFEDVSQLLWPDKGREEWFSLGECGRGLRMIDRAFSLPSALTDAFWFLRPRPMPISANFWGSFRPNSHKIVILSGALHRWIACHCAWPRVVEGPRRCLSAHVVRSFSTTAARCVVIIFHHPVCVRSVNSG